MALLTPIAGVVADRFERRTVAVLANLVVVALALALALVTRAGLATLPVLFTLAAVLGAARAFFGPAMSATIAQIVPAQLMPKAIATSSIAWQIASVAGPATGGVLYAVRPELTYWAAAALTSIASVAVLAIGSIPPPPGNRQAHPFRQIAEGLAFVRNERFLLGCITLDLFAVLLGGATALLPVYARDFLFVDGVAVGSRGLGLMRAAPGLGAALVAATLAFRPLTRQVGNLMLGSVVVFGLVTALFGASRNFHLSLLLLVLLGAADMVSVFIRSTLVQLNTPNAMRGRISSISGLAISASNELGEMESGLLAALIGAPAAVIGGGLAAIVVTALWARLFPELRRADTFAPQYRDGALT